jgi:ABC-type bacteriocin/lantibiotic exporter with double-glycine peptidase domain
LKGVTKIIITHKPELLESCEKIYKVDGGTLHNVK